MQCFTKLATSHSTWNMQKTVTIASIIIIIITKIKSFLDIYYTVQFSHQDIPWDNRIVDQTVPKMISYYTLIQWILKEILSKTINYSFFTTLPHAGLYTWKWVNLLYLSSKILLVCVVAHQWDLSLFLIEVLCTIFWVGLQQDGKLLKLCLFHPLYIHANSPGYRTNLLVSRTGNQISRIKVTLNLCTTVCKCPVSKCTLIKTISFSFKLTLLFHEALF